MEKEIQIDRLALEVAKLVADNFSHLGSLSKEDEWFGSNPKFDSLQSLQLVSVLENHFAVRFKPHELNRNHFKNAQSVAILLFSHHSE